jgi:hypothetical protein
MLRSCRKLVGYRIHTSDGGVGELYDFYFDDRSNRIIYAVVTIGKSSLGLPVLLDPAAFGKPDRERKVLPISLSRAEVLNAPDWDSVKPVYRHRTAESYAPVLDGTGSNRMVASLPLIPSPLGSRSEREAREEMKTGHGRVRSFREVSRYSVWGADGPIGNLVDFVLTDDTWQFPYVAVETGRGTSRRHVLIPSASIERVSWDDRMFLIDIPRKLVLAAPYFASP